MVNARDEFLVETKDKDVLCAHIEHGKKIFSLRVGYTADDLADFLKSLNFSYDDGYGGQELYGTIWYSDGTWSERGEYDGAEWWDFKKCPDIPVGLSL